MAGNSFWTWRAKHRWGWEYRQHILIRLGVQPRLPKLNRHGKDHREYALLAYRLARTWPDKSELSYGEELNEKRKVT